MYALDRSVESLLAAVRGSNLSSLAEDIQAHLFAGKVPHFKRVANQYEQLEEKRVSTLVAKDRSGAAPVEVNPTDEDLSIPFTPEEQIDEALRLIRERLEATLEMSEDIERATVSLGVPGVDLIYMTGENADRLTTPHQAAVTLDRWNNIGSRVRNWMQMERTAAARDAD